MDSVYIRPKEVLQHKKKLNSQSTYYISIYSLFLIFLIIYFCIYGMCPGIYINWFTFIEIEYAFEVVAMASFASRRATIINIQKNQLKLNSESIMELNIYV